VALDSAKVPKAVLAGRKLLLADDSITIQKIVELTFADEGVDVVCVNNGRDAIERLEEFVPDIVLADVFMPQVNGYEVCRYIKENEKLKHIPVMLLVGSFEPFDEAEARKVGANDILTKPFESIRRLLDKVGILTSKPTEEQISTAELPHVVPRPEPEILSEQEIARSTADTKDLPPELREVVDRAAAAQQEKREQQFRTDSKADERTMETNAVDTQTSEQQNGSGEVLLDLGDYAPVGSDEFVLDVDFDDIEEPARVESAYQTPAPIVVAEDKSGAAQMPGRWPDPMLALEHQQARTDQLATTQEFARPQLEPPDTSSLHDFRESYATDELASPTPVVDTQPAPAVSTPHDSQSFAELSPAQIDAIARRAVEHMSERVVQEIAWEVVPQLAELMIKRQLEEKNS
jgi:CheY-like chemotaxis protein